MVGSGSGPGPGKQVGRQVVEESLLTWEDQAEKKLWGQLRVFFYFFQKDEKIIVNIKKSALIQWLYKYIFKDFVLFLVWFETGSHVAQAGLKLAV